MSGVYSVRGDEPIFIVEKLSGVLVLQLIADPSASNYHSKQFEYNRMMKSLSDPETTRLLFDFRDCITIDSVTLGILVSLTQHLDESDGQTAMCNCSLKLRKLMSRLMSLEPVCRQMTWSHYPSRRHAVETLCCRSN